MGIPGMDRRRRYDCGMDASQSALDSLRTVEFRETLKGYHRDDVDEYLEKAAVEAEGLQEQLRQNGERLRKAAETIAQLETQLAAKPAPAPAPAPAPVVVAPVQPVVADDTLQRTLILAQKFIDETKADAEAEASRLVADAEAQARKVQADSELRLREEIARLESNRSHLSHEVETMARQIETERERIRTALAEMIIWVDGNLQTQGGADARSSQGSPVTNILDGQKPAVGAGGVTEIDATVSAQPEASGSLPL